MSHNPFTVEFPDGSRLYGVSNGYVRLRPLFVTPEEAMNYSRDALYNAQQPADAHQSEVEVTIDPGEVWEEINKASFTEKWLTGPANTNERLAERTIDPDYPTWD